MAISQNELRHMAAIGMQHLLSLHEGKLPVEHRAIAEPKPKRRMSAKGRANIRAAQARRWARYRKARMVA